MELRKTTAKEGTSIEYMSPELLFLAQSGQPYRGTLYIKFVSRGESVDLVDLKKYITSLRQVTLNSEDIAYEIYNTIVTSISADELGVVVDLTARGGIQQRIAFGCAFEPIKKQTVFQLH